MGYIKSGVEDGATIAVGGQRAGQEGYFIQPTIFTNVKPSMKIVQEEIFGPVCVVLKFKDEDDIVAQANDTIYGLAASVYSQNVTRAYYVANVFKRAQGQGRIVAIEGLEELKRRFGPAIVNIDLLPVGASRRDWVLTLISDGYLTVRHPDKQTLWDMADAVGTDLRLYAA